MCCRISARMTSFSISQPTIGGHVAICRADHWVKNVFVLPGIVAAVALTDAQFDLPLLVRATIGLIGMCITASSYYTLNEIVDAPFDREHPTKRLRPVPNGRVH